MPSSWRKAGKVAHDVSSTAPYAIAKAAGEPAAIRSVEADASCDDDGARSRARKITTTEIRLAFGDPVDQEAGKWVGLARSAGSFAATSAVISAGKLAGESVRKLSPIDAPKLLLPQRQPAVPDRGCTDDHPRPTGR